MDTVDGTKVDVDADDGVELAGVGEDKHEWWLLKVPHGELAEAISSAVDNELIGSVVIKTPQESVSDSGNSRKRKAQKIVKLAIDENLAKRHAAIKHSPNNNAPELYSEYSMTQKVINPESMQVLSEESDSGGALVSATMNGAIKEHFTLQADSSAIRDRFTKRVREDATKEQTTGLSGTSTLNKFNPRGKIAMEKKQRAAANAAKNPTTKRTAFGLTTDEIRTRLFKRFEEFTYYSLTHLAKLENLPQMKVREVLLDIAEKEVDGDHRDKWALKPAYRK